MPAAEKICHIETASFEPTVVDEVPTEDGFWNLRVSVTVAENSYSTTHRIEGDASWTEARLTTEVLKLY